MEVALSLNMATASASFASQIGRFAGARLTVAVQGRDDRCRGRHMTLTARVALSALLSCVAVAEAQQSPSAQVPAAVQERLAALVPSPLPAQATAPQPPAYYDSPTLYQYMDGAADAFQDYDVVALFHHDLTAGPVDVTVDIFDMGTPESAFGMYAAERSPGYDFVTIGTEGYRNEGILNFFQDRYYVKLAAFGDGADAVLQQFATAIAVRIGGSRSFPSVLSKLPEAQRKPRTELYLSKDPLGHPFLRPAYQATYGLEGGEGKLLISLGASAADAASRFTLLEEHFRRTGQWTPAPEFGSGAARATNSFEGSLVATTAGSCVVILLNPSSSATTFFKEAVARLR